MSCLFGPAFSLVANSYFPDNSFDCSINFDNPSDEALVLSYEWYLDDCLVVDKTESIFQSLLSCGSHKIGVRILTAEGWSGIVSHAFATCRVPVSLAIHGPEGVYEGDNVPYIVYRIFSDGTFEESTSIYDFQSSAGGSFVNNVFYADRNDTDFSDKHVTISVLQDNVLVATKVITVFNTTPVIVAYTKITGPSSLQEGQSGTYSVIAVYNNGTETDVSTQYTFSASEGNFVGRVYTATTNSSTGDNRQVRLDALQDSVIKASMLINVIDASIAPGILVVDFYNDSSLNIIAFVENTEVALNHVAASTLENIVPASAAPADALILASDLNPSGNTNWRFELNIEKLVLENPATTDFSFIIKGRGTSAGQISGAYSLRTNDGVMTLIDIGGNLMPSVSGGSDIGGLNYFSQPINSGANGSYLESDLSFIMAFNYNAPSKNLSISNPVIIDYSLQRNQIPYVDASFTLQKNGVTTDLVTFVGTGTTSGNYRIGDTLTIYLFHYLSARWPEDGSISLNIKDASGNILHHYQGGSVEVVEVYSHNISVDKNYYMIEVSSNSNDTSLSTPGYSLFSDRYDIPDGAFFISITDTTTGYMMLSHFPMPGFNQLRNGAYNMVNDNGSQKILFENMAGEQVTVTLRSDAGFLETFDMASGSSIEKILPDKSGIEVYLNPLPI